MTDKKAQLTGAEEVAWDLSDLFASHDDPAIDRDLDEADSRADKLSEEYRGRIAELDAEEMRDLLVRYEGIQDLAGKVAGYAYVGWTTRTEDPAWGALLQKSNERTARLIQKLVFVELEWANAPDDRASAMMDDPVLEHYRHWLVVTRLNRPYLLTEPEEKILAEKSITGRSAWVRFFDEVHGASRYEWDGEKLPQQVVLAKLFDRDREVRKRAAATITDGLGNLSRTTTFIFNTLLADKASDDQLRKYPTWITSRNMDNQVDDETVEALIKSVTSRYDIVTRYYKLKKRLLGLDELYDYDRYAPLPAADRRYKWDEGCEIVLDAFNQFDSRMSEIAGKFIEKRWIDAAVRPGKSGGAYMHPIVPSAHPYVFMNYEALPTDVMTLAHELGHGIHAWLARDRGILQANTPLTTAETASVFGEMLVFHDLLSRETDPAVRLAMLTHRLEDSFATVFRQVSMNRFEHAAHTARREEGELTTERFSELWLETQRAMFMDSLTMTDDYGIWWSYVPHFLHYPGYVYAYAFGELLVLALYARYQEAKDGFADAYLDMLSAGGSNWPHEIVKPFGVDLTDPNFWNNGLQILGDMVVEAEGLAEQAG